MLVSTKYYLLLFIEWSTVVLGKRTFLQRQTTNAAAASLLHANLHYKGRRPFMATKKNHSVVSKIANTQGMISTKLVATMDFEILCSFIKGFFIDNWGPLSEPEYEY